MSELSHSLKKAYYALRKLPALGYFSRRRYDKIFYTARNANLFRGVYASMAEAEASAIDPDRVGTNRKEPAEMYQDSMTDIFSTDYPVLFWLNNLLADDYSVFDLGGHIGVSFYAYSQIINWPESLNWRVCDVPAVIDIGKKLAIKESATNLSFTSKIGEMDGADLVIASGSLQWRSQSRNNTLGIQTATAGFNYQPVTLHTDSEFVTLQNIGTALCPYRVFNFEKFQNSLIDIDYKLIGKWENPEKSCLIPFYEQY